MTVEDAIGVVREHRWASADAQAKRLREDGCSGIISLSGGAKLLQGTRADLQRMATKGRTFKLLWAFLLADPRKGTAGAMTRDLRTVLDAFRARGAYVKDVETGLSTEKPAHLRALMAVAKDMIGRSRQGLKSHLNGERAKGRPRVTFSAEQMKDAKATWRNTKDYPTWGDAAAVLPEGFTTARAHKLWGPRQ